MEKEQEKQEECGLMLYAQKEEKNGILIVDVQDI